VIERKAKPRKSQTLDVWRLFLLAIAFVALPMLHAATDAFAAASLAHDHPSVLAIDVETETCCSSTSSRTSHVVDCETGGHCPVYVTVVPASLSADDRTALAQMLDETGFSRNRATGPFRPPQTSAA
jgi:hypothetical protein